MIAIDLNNAERAFRPGQPIEGVARWALDRSAPGIEIRLFWYTAGKGDQDIDVVESVNVAHPPTTGEHAFSFRAPEQPSSFSGKLISLTWAIEVVAIRRKESERQDIVISPTGREIRLA